MKRIYKYPVTIASQSITLPRGAEVVHFESQHHRNLNIWALCDESQEPEIRRFYVAGTGWDVPDSFKYIKTTITTDGSFVWHLFEEVQPEVE